MDNKRSISEKYSLDYYRHSLPTRAWKSRWNYLALLLALLAFCGMYSIGRNTIFQAAPVASVHSSFGTDCAACHDQSWGTLRRLAARKEPHSVSNDACQKCHHAAKHADIVLAEPTCAECHQEHRPEKRLTALADGTCTRCHSGLVPAVATESSFTPKISRFEAGAGGHPEFALLRTSQEGVGVRHTARRVAEFKPASGTAGKWVDRSGLIFNHRHHLNPALVLGTDRKPVKLICADCHVSGANGYMEPVNYEQHCSRCHPLRLVAPFAEIGELPHSSLEEVRGVLRERIAKQLANPSTRQKVEELETQFLRLPRPVRLTADQERDLSSQTERADHAMFGPEAKGTCSRCHSFGQRNNTWYVNMHSPAVSDDQANPRPAGDVEMVPSRWMQHATFSHKSHRAIECAACHDAANSNQTSDILMPSIAVCQRCHGDGAQTSRPHVSADCVLCHTYHMESVDKESHGLPLEQLFSSGSSNNVGDATR